jgi:dihydroorotate dehydrogenase
MTDNEDQEGSQDPGTDRSTESDSSTNRIDEMEQGVERVGDEIADAEEKAREATALDPQPLAGTEGEPSSSN